MILAVLHLAAITGPVPKIGVVALSLLVACVLLAPRAKQRAFAMLAALILSPVLLFADIWHSPQLSSFHRHALITVGLVILALAVVVALALAITRRSWLFAPLVCLVLPFRVPIEAGGATSNLLVPMYLVVAAGSLSLIVETLRPGGRLFSSFEPGAERDSWAMATAETPAVSWVLRLLAVSVVLYALQAVYSSAFEKALQQMVFFYVPFALVFRLLVTLRWSPRVLRACLVVAVSLASAFALIAFVEYATKTVILNPKLVVQNDLHAYFTVNSVFFDPDIFGRFLALVMIMLVAILLYDRRAKIQAAAISLLALLWGGLVLTLSRSSVSALLVGMAALAAMRWIVGRTLLLGVVLVLLGASAVAISPKTFGLNQGLNGVSSGRAGLISGGVKLWEQRPLWGYGSGSFVAKYRAENPGSAATVSASHTIPVTVAAEQGLIGEIPYVALVVMTALALFRGARADPTRAAVAAAFLALVFHTLLYADFLEDPVTWTLLGIGCAMALADRPSPSEVRESTAAVAA